MITIFHDFMNKNPKCKRKNNLFVAGIGCFVNSFPNEYLEFDKNEEYEHKKLMFSKNLSIQN